ASSRFTRARAPATNADRGVRLAFGRFSVGSGQRDHLAHAWVISSDGFDPRLESRYRIPGAEQDVPDVHVAHEREAAFEVFGEFGIGRKAANVCREAPELALDLEQHARVGNRCA